MLGLGPNSEFLRDKQGFTLWWLAILTTPSFFCGCHKVPGVCQYAIFVRRQKLKSSPNSQARGGGADVETPEFEFRKLGWGAYSVAVFHLVNPVSSSQQFDINLVVRISASAWVVTGRPSLGRSFLK